MGSDPCLKRLKSNFYKSSLARMACNSAISADVSDTSVFQFDSCPLGFGLACLIDLPAISELDSWFFGTLFVLVVGVAAIEKRAHDQFSEASSGPRSMA